jgi:hypothetical protein
MRWVDFFAPTTDAKPVGISIFCQLGWRQSLPRSVAAMCNLYRMEDKDWVNKSAHGVESLINLMPAYQMNPMNGHLSSATLPTAASSWSMRDGVYLRHDG